MFKKSISILLSIIMIATMSICLCACDGSDADNFPVNINGITINEEPENIVVLSSEHADIISYIGYDVKMVGKSSECDHEYFKRVPSVGFEANPDIDAIIALETDLVITANPLPKDAQKKLSDNNITVVNISVANKFSDAKNLYQNLGMILGGNKTGKEKGLKAYNELFDMLKEFEVSVPKDIITTACYLYIGDNGKLCTFTKDSVEFNTFSYCGAKNSLATQQTPEVDIEKFKFTTPSYIFYDNEAVLDILNSNPDLASLSAIKNNNLMQISKYDFRYLGITFYDTVYDMMDFMFFKDATADEASADVVATEPATTNESQPSEQAVENFTIE